MILQIDNSTSTELNWCAKGTERIVQNIVNILNTYKYEVAYKRNFSISPDIFDKDIETMKSILIEDLFDSIKENEPRATLKSVTIKGVSDDGGVIAAVEVEI